MSAYLVAVCEVKNANENLSPHLILELHRIVTNDTLENASAAGAWRTSADDVVIGEVGSGIGGVAERSLDEISAEQPFEAHAGWIGHVERER